MTPPCDWNPGAARALAGNEQAHAVATVCLGDGKWHLCAACAALPEFRRFRRRSSLAKAPAGAGEA